MKHTLIAAAFAFCALTALNGSARAEAKQDFALVNKTGYEIKEVYVSPSKSDDWQEDVLGSGTLGDSEKANIKFHRSVKTCKWDLKVVYTVDSSSAVWGDIDLCSVEKITIRYDKDADKTTATFD
jgi:hypothetical protein